MTARSSIRNRFARTPRTLRKGRAWCQQSLEALEVGTLLSVNFDPSPTAFHPMLVNAHTTLPPGHVGSVTSYASNQPPSGVLTPWEVRHIYGFDQINNLGSGQTIAIVDAYDDSSIQADLETFDKQFGQTSSGASLYAQFGPASSFLTMTNQNEAAKPLPDPDPTGGWEEKEALDVECAHAIPPQAKILLVEASSDDSDYLCGADDSAVNMGAKVVTNSWSGSESRDELGDDYHFTAKGVTFQFAAGDDGSPSYPATSPNVVSVGGTTQEATQLLHPLAPSY